MKCEADKDKTWLPEYVQEVAGCRKAECGATIEILDSWKFRAHGKNNNNNNKWLYGWYAKGPVNIRTTRTLNALTPVLQIQY